MKREFTYRASIGYAHSKREESVVLEFDDGVTEEEVRRVVDADFEGWLENVLDSSWEEITV